MQRINVCVCTCLRGEMLKVCLRSVAAISVPDGAEVTLSVIDNDAARTAESLIESMKKDFPFPVHYFCETRRGIPYARNRAIEETLILGSDYLVFLDDDEWVETDWLQQLYDLCQQHGGNVVVSGSVWAELPEGISEDIAGLYNRKDPGKAGSRKDACATNNVLVPMACIHETGLRFDETNPLAGGTDTIFFKQASSRGVLILRCPQAVAHELVPKSRATLQWWARRKYRAGITHAWRKRMRGKAAAAILISALFQIMVELVKAALFFVSGKKLKRNQSLLKVCRCAGVISGIMGIEVESYRVIDG